MARTCMTVLCVVLALLAGAGAAAWWTERDRRRAAEKLAGTAWTQIEVPPPVPAPESLEARAMRIEGERTRTGVVDRLVTAGLSQKEAERLWSQANGESP